MKKFLYIVNPEAGNGNGKKSVKKIKTYCNSHNIKYELVVTKFPLHATEITKKHSAHFTHIVAVGGDGTVNEVINGMHLYNNTVFAALQIGTGNDLIKNFKYPKKLTDILDVIHSDLKQKILTIDVGKVIFTNDNSKKKREHLFVNNLGIGFDAYVGYLNRKNKKVKGASSYVFAVLKALRNFKMIDIAVDFNGIKIRGRKLMLTIGNGISSGGGFYLTPNAVINDNLLDVSIFDEISRLRLLNVLPKALFNKLHNVKEAKMFKSSKISIDLKEPYFVHCDGEIISNEIKNATVKCLPNALKIITKK